MRIQKGLFLLAREAELPADEQYDFRAYSYGPCSFDIYDDLRWLVKQDLIALPPQAGRSWGLYSPTSTGAAAAEAFLGVQPPERVEQLRTVRSFVEQQPFQKLLREVYARYPEYAENSVVSFGS